MAPLSPQRSANLSKRLYASLSTIEIRPPRVGESEPSYTRSVLAPEVIAELSALEGLSFTFRGDGGVEQAVPADALEIQFFPDLAVSLGPQHLWAAEVKILRTSNRQNSIATALGQATLYRSRYDHVLVILIDMTPASKISQRRLADQAREMGLRILVRPRHGQVLLPHPRT